MASRPAVIRSRPEGTLVAGPRWDAHEDAMITSCSLSRDGKLLFTADEVDEIRLWRLTDRGEATLISRQDLDDDQGVVDCAFSPVESGQMVVAAGGELTLWKTNALTEPEQSFATGESCWCCTYSPNGQWIAAGCDDNVHLFRPGAIEKKSFETESEILAISFCDDHTVAATGRRGETMLWDLDDHTDIGGVWDTQLDARFVVAKHSADGRLLAASDSEGGLHLYQMTGKKIADLPRLSHELPLRDLAFSPDGSMLLAVSSESAALWRTADAQRLDEIELSIDPGLCSFASNGTIVVAGYRGELQRIKVK